MQTELLAESTPDLNEAPQTVSPVVGDAAATPIRVSLLEIDDLEQAGVLWTELQLRSRHSFFTSWGWIGCWLSQLPKGLRPRLLIAENQSGIVGLAFLARKRIWRGNVIPSRTLFLHETGIPVYDSLTIEHNGFLAERGSEEAVQRAMIDSLCDHLSDWDELFLPGIDADSSLLRILQAGRSGFRFRIEKQSPCYMVDLARLRESGEDFCSSLGSSTRANLRKSIRLYEERGPLTTVAARDAAEALRFFEELKALHVASWGTRGESGAFADPWLDEFHRHLIKARFACGEIQLLHVRAGEQLIGALYNFVLDGHVAFYQSGFLYEENPKLKPGLVCHTLAIEMNCRLGARTYDFLAGDSQYKRSLGQETREQLWGILQRRRLRFRIEDLLRSAKCLIAGLISRKNPPRP